MKVAWRSAALGEVCELIKRGVAPRYTESAGVRVVNQKCIRDHQINMDFARRHDLAARPVNSERYIKLGDVLINSTGTGTLGRIAQVRSEPDQPTTVDTHVTIVRPKSDTFYPAFFGYMLMMIEDEIINSGEGASGQTELPRTKLEKHFQVSFAESKEEQKRIVAILDEAFAGIATAVANTEKNLANARELFESYLNAVLSQRDEAWTERALGQLADFKNGLNFTKNSRGESVRIVGVKNFKSNYWVPTDSLEEVKVEGRLPIAYELKKNDIVIVRSNGNKQLIGRCLLAGDVLEKTSHSGFTIRARLTTDEMHPEFLMHYLRTSPIREQLVASGDGANISSLNQKALATLPVRYPATAQQLVIVRGIQEIDAESKQLESIYKEKLHALAELKLSLLQKAFTGELTAAPQYEIETALA